MSLFKCKAIRLQGVRLKKLVEAVYERDRGMCVNCGRGLEFGHKPHHIIFKSHGGGDTMDNLVLLCPTCHNEVHSGRNGNEIKDKIKRYIEWMEDNEIHNEFD